jgi:Uncharacterised protein family (UPF0236)
LNKVCSHPETESLPSVEDLLVQIISKCWNIIDFCLKDQEDDYNFLKFERDVQIKISELGCLFIQLFLISNHERLDCSKWISNGLYYAKTNPVSRTVKTIYGKVRYCRTYLILKGKKNKGGFYPLDMLLGITIDGFSPSIMSLAARLATRVSFETSVLLFTAFYGWSPSGDSIKSLVLGLGREAGVYMEQVAPPAEDGDVLIIEVDGKATPTATEEELSKRRRKRDKSKKKCCCCKRHRGKLNRKNCKCKRRKKGDKSKNGRSITLVVMYTLKRGSDGLLHGPINKIVWGSYAPRKKMLEWARRQATKRGFPPGTTKRIHIGIDGEKCLKDGLSKLFPKASFFLDIRHLEEYIWKVGRKFFKEGSKELENWFEEKRSMLYEGSASELLEELKKLLKTLSARAKRDEAKREALKKIIQYMETRLSMMFYKEYIEDNLPIATGAVEGAARHVVGERMDCGGMRWIPERAEALLHLRCIELNGNWNNFFEWGYKNWQSRMRQNEKVLVRTNEPINIDNSLELLNAA